MKQIYLIMIIMITPLAMYAEDVPQATEGERKIIIAVLPFRIQGADSNLENVLADTVMSALEKTGRIETISREKIIITLGIMDTTQTLSGDSEQTDKLYEKMKNDLKVDFIVNGSIDKVGNKFKIKIQLIRFSKEYTEVPLIQEDSYREDDIEEDLAKCAEELALHFPLHGKILALLDPGYVAINIGKSHNVHEDNEFLVFKEKIIRNDTGEIVFTENKEVGRIKVTQLQNFSAQARIVGLNKGIDSKDLIELDQKAYLGTIKLEREKRQSEKARDAAREAELARARDFGVKNSLFRFGFSGINFGNFYTLTNADPILTSAYGSGWGGFIDWVASAPPLGYTPGLFLNFYMRAIFRSYSMTDADLLKNPAYLAKGAITQFGVDTGLRFTAGLYFLWMQWSFFVGAAPRIHVYTETAGSLSNTFWSLGVVANAGVEIAILPTFAIFAEGNYGYVPVGSSKANIEGLQIFAGLSIRK